MTRRSLSKKAITRMQQDAMLATKKAYQRLHRKTLQQDVCVAGMQRAGTNMLLDAFAPAKALWLVRDYNDAVSSALVSFTNFAVQLGRIVEYRPAPCWRGRNMSDTTYALVRSLYTPT